jgi:uncharacterized protein YodC (DUF2158 family)
MAIEAGDRVRHTSGGPVMTVERLPSTAKRYARGLKGEQKRRKWQKRLRRLRLSAYRSDLPEQLDSSFEY